MTESIRSGLVRYAIAIGLIGGALVVEYLTWPLLKPTPYQLFYFCTGVVAWRYGIGPTIVALILSIITVDHFFLQPQGVLSLGASAIGPILIAAAAMLAIARVGTIARRTREELAATRSSLEVRVHRRTLELERKNAELVEKNMQRELAEEALRHSNRRQRLISENILDVITILGPDGQIHYESPSVERVLGYAAEELVGTNAFERVHLDDLPSVLEVFQEAIANPDSTRRVQLRFKHKDGSWRMLEVVGRNLLDDPVVNGVLISSRDVTDRWEAERNLHQQREFLHAVLENAQDAIVAFDDRGCLTFVNRAAREIYPSAHSGMSIDEWLHDFEVYDADGTTTLDRNTSPLYRAVNGEQFRDIGFSIKSAERGLRQLLASAKPIADASGEGIGSVLVAHDITDLARAEREREAHIREQVARRAGEEQQRRLEFLVGAGAALAESLDFENTLRNVARLAIGVLADWCVVDILDESGHVNRIAAGHADPAKEELARELLRFPPDRSRREGVPKVLRSGRPEIVAETTDAFLREAARDEEHLTIVRELGTTSAMYVPLVAHERVVGAISFFSSSERRYNESDLTLASELARRGGLAIESARLYQAERRARTEVERSARRTEQLQSITAAFAEALTTQHVADVMLGQGLPIVGAAAGSIGVIAETGHEIEIVRSIGYTAEQTREWSMFSIDAPVPIARAVRLGQPVFFTSREEVAKAFPRIEPKHPDSAFAASAAVPLSADDRIIGALSLSFTNGDALDADNRPMILALARQCGQALDRARLYDAERLARAEAEHARRSLSAIAEASAVLSSQLDFHATLRSIARLAVPMLADTCVVDVLEESGTMRRVAVAATSHSIEHMLQEMMQRFPTGSRESLRYQVLGTGQPILVARTDESWIKRVAVDPEHAAMLRSLAQRSYLYLPLRARGRTFGAIGLATLDGRRPFTDADIPPAQEIALRAAVALDNARLYEEAQEANHAKDEFLATVSHEVRTPLNAILGWSQMLRDGELDEETSAHAVEAIERNAKAQAQIIEDILDVSRVIAGKLRLEPRRVNVAAVVSAALDSVRPPAEAASVTLIADVPSDLPDIVADPGRLQQVLWNLLLNAIKFTPAGGRVTLEVRAENSEIILSVVDTGAGIEPEFLPFVFERFRQADGGSVRRHGGLGLGLAIVRAIVQMHGGRVGAESAGLGQGSTFTVRLPVAEFAHSSRDGADGYVRTAPDSALDGLRIVIVDDEVDARELLAMALERHGAEVRSHDRADSALATIRQWHPDLLVSDIAMPGQDGYSLVAELRALSADDGGETPAVALTAYARLEDRDRAIRAGFQEHMPKPVDYVRLVRVLAELARGREKKTQ